jgi:hypothetical protein
VGFGMAGEFCFSGFRKGISSMGSIVSREVKRLPDQWFETIARVAAASQLPLSFVQSWDARGKCVTDDGSVVGRIYYYEGATRWECGLATRDTNILRGPEYRCGGGDYRGAAIEMFTAMMGIYLQVVSRRTTEYSAAHKDRGRVSAKVEAARVKSA